MKKILLAALMITASQTIWAQANSTAQQRVNLALTDAIEIAYGGSGSGVGGAVTLTFAGINDYHNGVVSWDEYFRVRSNRNFNVTVKTNAANFTYAGSVSPAPVMPVSGVLDLIVTSNNTGGTVASPFTLNSTWAGLSNAAQPLISNGSRGDNQMYGIKYRATPGFNYPAGSYTVEVIYTATQP